MDELSVDERDKRTKYHSDVGYLPRKRLPFRRLCIDLIVCCDRAKVLRLFRSFTSMCVLRSW